MNLRIFYILILLIFQVTVAWAQPGGGDPGHGRPVPISGIEILLMAGAIFGVRRILDLRKKNS